MNPDFSKQWQDLYGSVNKQMMQFTKLNSETLDGIMNSHAFEEVLSVKKPEELVPVYLKFATEANLKAMKYIQEAIGIMMNASCDAADHVSSMTSEIAKQQQQARASRTGGASNLSNRDKA